MRKNKLNYFDYLGLARHELEDLYRIHPELSLLSRRELEVFSELLSDKTQAEIAAELFVSESSIHFHCRNIYRKLELSSRKQLLVKYKDI